MGACCCKSEKQQKEEYLSGSHEPIASMKPKTKKYRRPSKDRKRPGREKKRFYRSEETVAYQLLVARKQNVCVAVFPYTAGCTAEVTLAKGDRVEVEPNKNESEDFVFVRLLGSRGGQGYVATNFLAPEFSVEAEDYYFGSMKRRASEKILRNEELPNGAYLVRDAESRPINKNGHPSLYAISVLDRTKSSPYHHYRVFDRGPSEPDRRYYILKNSTDQFPRVQDIIAYYSRHVVQNEICCKLTNPLMRPPPIRKTLSKDLADKWREIPRNEIQLGGELGQGHYGIVYKAKWTAPGSYPIDVAVKQMQDFTPRTKEDLFKEAAAMRDLSHPNIIRLYGVVSTGEPCMMITELVRNGSLKNFLQVKNIQLLPSLPESELIDIAIQICKGMAYLASKNILHRDLAARNVLINELATKPEKIEAKISDFGLARVLHDRTVYKMRHQIAMPHQWLSPEAYNKAEFTTKSDVWAYGATLCELFGEGRDPFETTKMNPIKLQRCLRHGTRPEAPRAMRYGGIEDLIFRPCTRFNPNDRPTFEELLTDWDTLVSSAMEEHDYED